MKSLPKPTLLEYILYPIYQFCFAMIMVIFEPIQRIGSTLDYFFKGNKYHLLAVKYVNYFLVSNVKLLSIKVDVKFEEPISYSKKYIIVSNHQSLLDPPIIDYILPELQTRYIAKKELGKYVPSVSYNLTHGGSALVDRKNPKQAIGEILKLVKRTNNDTRSVACFPEGTRAKDGVLKKYKATGFSILYQKLNDVKILPVTIDGSWMLQARKYGPIPRRITITCTVHKPITVDKDRSAEDVLNEIEEQTRKTLGGTSMENM